MFNTGDFAVCVCTGRVHAHLINSLSGKCMRACAEKLRVCVSVLVIICATLKRA